MSAPVMPPKPRVSFDSAWIVDTGHADVTFDTWPEAIAHALRICADYRLRLVLWSLAGRTFKPTDSESSS